MRKRVTRLIHAVQYHCSWELVKNFEDRALNIMVGQIQVPSPLADISILSVVIKAACCWCRLGLVMITAFWRILFRHKKGFPSCLLTIILTDISKGFLWPECEAISWALSWRLSSTALMRFILWSLDHFLPKSHHYIQMCFSNERICNIEVVELLIPFPIISRSLA